MNAPLALPPGIPTEISREALALLPIGRCDGEIALVDTPAELERAMADIQREQAVGWDIETRPAFRKGEVYPPSLIQVATARAVYVLQFARMDASAEIASFFASPTVVKAGISVADDLKKLAMLFPLQSQAVLDLGTVAKRHGMEQTGLRNLAGIFLGMRIPKGAKTTNWSVPRLSAQQLNYAAMDAWVCRALYLKFRELGML